MPVFVSSRKANGLKTGKKRAARLPEIGPDIRHGTGRTVAPLYLLTGCRHPAILSYCYTDGQTAKSRPIRANNTTYLPPIRENPNKTRKGSGLTVRNLYGKGITGCAIFPRPVKNCQQVDSCAGRLRLLSGGMRRATGRTVARRSTAGRGERLPTSGTAQDAAHVGTGNAPDGRARTPQAANVPRTCTAQAERLRRRRRSGRHPARAGRSPWWSYRNRPDAPTGSRPSQVTGRTRREIGRTVAPHGCACCPAA